MHEPLPSRTRSNTSPRASPAATTPLNPQRTSRKHSYRKASPQFASASPMSSPDPASAEGSRTRLAEIATTLSELRPTTTGPYDIAVGLPLEIGPLPYAKAPVGGRGRVRTCDRSGVSRVLFR